MRRQMMIIHTTHQMSIYVLLSLLVGLIQGNGYSFRREPEKFYYAFPGTAQVIPCEAIETRDDGTEHLIDVMILKDSKRLDPDRPPERILPLVTERRIAGILIVPVKSEDSGSVYQCVVEINGRRELSSLPTTLFVGDGFPLAPLSNPAQVGETLTTVTINWGEAPVPLDAPLQGYTVSVVSVQNDTVPLELSTQDNATTIQLFNLIPGQEYRVMVFGRNSIGRGTPSATLVARTVVPVPPHQPLQVHGVVEVFGKSSSINVSWMQPEINLDTMTPVDYFIVFYGVAQMQSPLSEYENVTTANNSTNMFTISGITTGGKYSVGVAAINSAGRSEVTFSEETLEVSSYVTTNTRISQQTLVIIGALGTSLLLILTIIILILLIIYVRRKIRKMTEDLNHPDGCINSNDSPSSKRKGLSSPPKLSNKPHSVHSDETVELNVRTYEVEPRRAGSQSPDQIPMEISRLSGSISSSTFTDNSIKYY